MKKIMKSFFTYIKSSDVLTMLLCLILSGLSVLFLTGIVNSEIVRNVSSRTVLVQVGATSFGIFLAIVFSAIDYRSLAKQYKIYIPITYGLVLLTFFIGLQREGADDRSWIMLPLNMTLQPAEFLKIAFILSFALHLSIVRTEINSIVRLAPICVHGAIPILLVHFQGDDGTALVFAVIFLCMLFAAGINWFYILSAIAVSAITLPLTWLYVLNYDQKMRILTVFDPERDPKNIGFQQLQSKLAIGSGQLKGRGILTGQHKFVPEIHNDFIFSFIGESIGFIGCLLIFALFCTLCVKMLITAVSATDYLGRYICVGVFAMIAFQTIANIGMCLSLLPVIGITLPFLSAGGTSVVSSYIAIGLVLSVYMRRTNTMFS